MGAVTRETSVVSLRSHFLSSLFAVGTVIVTDLSSARADDKPVESAARSDRLLAIEGGAGIGTPLGWTGASFVLTPLEMLALHGGVGLGTNGIQAAFGARFITESGLGIGASWSTGSYAGLKNGMFGGGAERAQVFYWQRAHFLNLEVSLEIVRRGRFYARPFAGLGLVLNGDSAVCVNVPDACAPSFAARLVPYLGFAVAYEVL